ARQRPALEEGLPAREVARLLRGQTCFRRLLGLPDDAAGLTGVLLEPLGQLGVDGGLDERAHRGVAELRLGLTLELRLAKLDRDDRDQPFADVLADQVVLFLLQEALLARVAVEHVREGLLEALLVHAALVGVDRVGERIDRLAVGVRPLHRDLDLAVVALVLDGDDPVEGVLALAEVLHEVHEAAVGLVDLLALVALIDELDLDALVQEAQLVQALGQDLLAELGRLGEDLGVRPEADQRARLLGRLALRELLGDLAAAERHRVDRAVAAHLDLELLRQGVHDRDADAVQAARDRVAAAAELAAGVQDGQDHLERGAAVLRAGDRLDGDAAAVVEDTGGAVGVQGDDDPVAEPGHRLVDRVVDDLVHEVVEASDARGPEVHAGSLADRLETFEDLDVLRV